MSNTGNGGTNLVSIKEKYKTDSVHLLLPTVFEEQLNPFHKLSIMEVTADLSPDSGDVFKVGGQYVKTGKRIKGDDGNYKDEEVWTEYFSPAKPLLMKISSAAGIQFDPTNSGIINAGHNVYHARAYGAIKLPDGTYKTHYDEKLINLNDEEDKFRLEFMDKSLEGITGKAASEAAKRFKGKWIDVDKKYNKKSEKEKAYVIDDCDRQKYIDRCVLANMINARKHVPQKVLTGAILRVVRALIGMKGQYTTDELKKPFVLARVNYSPDYNDPEVKHTMLMSGMTSMVNIFGNSNQQTASQPVFTGTDNTVFDEGNIEDDPFISDSFKSQDSTLGFDEEDKIKPPWEQPQDFDETEDESYRGEDAGINPNVCQDCNTAISDKVSAFSHKKHGRYLCYNCQQGVK